MVEQTRTGINDKSRLEVAPGLWLDYRRAIYLEGEELLCVADLHLGYTWAHRYQGQMLPVNTPERLLERLLELCDAYHPRRFVFLGDIVHQAVPVSAIKNDFHELVSTLKGRCGVHLILGNHDRNLRELAGTEVEFHQTVQAGNYLLLHGNDDIRKKGTSVILMGHEHPAISLGDGVRSQKFPCFLISEKLLILPAFSLWAAGSDFRYHPFMSPLARSAKFEKAVAILGQKLLPVPISGQ